MFTRVVCLVVMSLHGFLTLSVGAGKKTQEVAVIETSHGQMVIELFDKIAPKHVESFKTHAKNGNYDQTLFHRVIAGFVIQGGDPITKTDDEGRYGTGGASALYYGLGDESKPETWTLPQEFNDKHHSKGTLSMARGGDPNSAGSQFFICTDEAAFLNRQYTVFGQLISGYDVLAKLNAVETGVNDRPVVPIKMKVTIEKRSIQ